MPDSKRLRILKELTTHLEATAGYNLEDKVWRGRRRPGQESEQPFILLFEIPPEYEDRADHRVAKMPWEIGVQGYVKAGLPHPTDPAHDFMAAVKQQVGTLLNDGGGGAEPEQFLLGGLVEDIEVDGGMCFEPDETTSCCFFALKLTLTITENLGDPYEQSD